MNIIGVCVLIFCGLFYFSEGKPCPEKTRGHKTRCDAYYKCREMPSDRHVWVPASCDKGLVYEHNLQMCVLPADDWECSLDSEKAAQPEHKDNGNGSEDFVVRTDDVDVDDVLSPLNGKGDAVELIVDGNMSIYDDSDDQDSYDSSGDGGELVELDGFMQTENRESDDQELKAASKQQNTVQLKESSGEVMATSTSSRIDPKLTAHLQRLSQLIDGLKESYKVKDDEQTEMRPDQLNAFLAHFNIKNKFETFNPAAQDQPTTTTSTMAPVAMKTASKNKTLLQDHLNKKLQPETKVVLTNGLPHPFDRNGYSNSQIVVNRPEGSVTFSLPSQYGGESMHEHSSEYAHNSPKISEETLKTVLELSKQMIASQNVPKVIQNPAYYPQPIYPVFVSSANFPGTSHKNPFGTYFQNNNNNNNNQNTDDYDTDDGQSASYHKPSHYHGYKKPSKHRPSGNGGYGSKPSTTIIHNNVIPLHLTSTNSGEKEVVDSYGQSLGVYPPHAMANSPGDMQNINHMHHHHSHRYENNKFITSVTTVRPIISSTPSNHYAAQYPSPYSTEMSLTTPGTLNVAEYYTPSPHLNENNVNSVFQYENLPRPLDGSRPANIYQQVERPTPTPSYYQQSMQQQHHHHQHNHNALFPGQIDPNKIQIRPNSQKIESMEMDTEDIVSAYPQQQQQQQQPQVLTYSYGNEQSSVTNQLAPALSYSDASTNMLSDSPNPYMSRPSLYASNAASISTVTISPNKPKYPAHTAAHDGENMQLVNVGGNFINYDVFQNTILPLMGAGSGGLSALDTLNSNVEVITCATGVRQPNTTDCTRYYVCSKKDGKVLSYSCPPYTAFNGQTRICDAHTYSYCNPDAVLSAYTVNENKRIQLEALKAMQDAKRRRQQALTAQSNLSSLMSQYSGTDMGGSTAVSSNEKDMLSSYMAQAASMSVFSSTTTRPTVVSLMPAKKRKYYCKEGDKIADQTSITSYFVCYKNAQGQMKGHKMSCSKGLVFCPKSKMCTLSAKCA